jgi:replicative DNA helicase
MERKGRIDLSTGLSDLDAMTGGFRRGEMAVIAGRPAMGKSTAGLAVAKAFAQRGQGACFFSMEMAEVALGLRMACDAAYVRNRPETRAPYFLADRGQLRDDQWYAYLAASTEMADWPLMFDTRPGQTPAQMEAKARRQFRKWEAAGIEPGCIVVDHLTIAGTDNDRRGNKVAEVGDTSRGLAEMAKRLNVPVIALCQLSRDVEKRDLKDTRPRLSDLRWSGEIEQDARLVLMLWRPEYYIKAPLDNDGDADIAYHASLDPVRNRLFWLVEKNNSGPTGQVETFCDMACSAIRDLAA